MPSDPASDLVAQLQNALARLAAGTSDYDLNPHVTAPRKTLRPAAVLVPIVLGGGGDARIILTKRASHLAHHPGQIAFPGGKVDARDASPTDTALREAREEIGLDPAHVRLIGTMPAHETVTSFHMTPVLGVLNHCPPFTLDQNEVAEVFTVPFAFATQPAHFRVESRIWQGQNRYFYTVPYGPYYIWGATARVLFALAKGLAA
jgi:8-oxo-dGTP pyrophosphatase MutT (NUDIX family)